MKTSSIFLYATNGFQDSALQFMSDYVPGLFVLFSVVWGVGWVIVKIKDYAAHNDAEHTAVRTDIVRLDTKVDVLDKKIDQRYDQLDQKIDDRFNQLDYRCDEITKRIDKMDDKLDRIVEILVFKKREVS